MYLKKGDKDDIQGCLIEIENATSSADTTAPVALIRAIVGLPVPARTKEPTGLCAVVRIENGPTFSRVDSSDYPWIAAVGETHDGSMYHSWYEITTRYGGADVTVLFEGVEA